jgi:hypothetical protein
VGSENTAPTRIRSICVVESVIISSRRGLVIEGVSNRLWSCGKVLNVGDEKPPHVTRVSKSRTVARIRYSRGEKRRVRQV